MNKVIHLTCSLMLALIFTAIPVCIYSQANVAVGKSFINITRPAGGTVIPGDQLEIRVSVFVTTISGNRTIFRTRYNDTIPNNLN